MKQNSNSIYSWLGRLAIIITCLAATFALPQRAWADEVQVSTNDGFIDAINGTPYRGTTTIKLMKNIEELACSLMINEKTIIVEMNGHNISCAESDGYTFDVWDGTLIFKNDNGTSTISGADIGVNKSSTLTFQGVSVSSGYISNYGTVCLNNSSIAEGVLQNYGGTVNYGVASVCVDEHVGEGAYTTYYASFSDAVTAANAATEPVTVTLLANVTELTSTIMLGNSSKVTLDLNGKTLSGLASTLIQVVSGALVEITDLSTDKGGVIENTNTSDGPKAISNNGTLTINGVTVKGVTGIINAGTLTVEDGTIEGSGDRGIGICNTGLPTPTATISGGSVKGTTGIENYGSLTLSGGTVESTFSNAINNNSDATLCSIGAATITGSDHGIWSEKDVTLTAWPTITSGNYGSDIFLGTNNIVFASGFNAAADTFSPISVSVSKVGADNPFTSGFSAANTGLKAWEAFAFESTITFVDENSAGEAMLVRCDEEISFPEGLSTYYFDNIVKNLNGGTSLTFYAVTGVSGDKVIVKELTEKCIAAGTPIIVSNTSGQEQSFTFVNGNVEWKATEIGNNFLSDMNGTATSSYFKGTAEAKTAYVPDGGATMYGFNGEAFVRLDAKPDIAAHRCWLEIPQESGTGSQAGARSLTIGFGGDGDGTTGVGEIKEVREVTDDTWYTLEGLKLSGRPQKKGIYVHGGRKVAIK